MASHRTHRSVLVLALVVVATAVALPVGLGNAAPRPTPAEVQARIDALDLKAEQAAEAFDAARIQLATASREAAVANARVRDSESELHALQRRMGSFAAAAYRSGGADQFVQLISTSTPQTFLDRASALDRIAATQAAQMAQVATARHRLAGVQADAAAATAAAAKVASTMAGQKASVERALAQEKALLGSLKADERKRLLALQQRAEAAARANRSRTLAPPSYSGPASGRAAEAIDAAMAQLGKPYVWGASGPNSFDCSGLTMWAWGKAGISLPHFTGAQWNMGRHVDRSEIQPGDLIFYFGDHHHVGIYLGGGRVIHAPHTGDVVKISNLDMDPYAGAVRVTG